MAKKPSSLQESFRSARDKVWQKKAQSFHPHQSFRRSYPEDYRRQLETPGLLHHAIDTFKIIFREWRLFLPLILLITFFNILFVGLMNEDFYSEFQSAIEQTNQKYAGGQLGNFAKAGLTLIAVASTGGFSQGLTEVQYLFIILIFLITWLVTIYLLRHRLAGHTLKLRDALYNALTPLLSTLVILIIFFIQLLPILVVVIGYSAALSTDFLSTPFYALIYFIFATLLTILSLYLTSNTLMALVAVTAPGFYPLDAMNSTADLIMGRRIKLIIRILFLIFAVALIYVIIMLPLILLDMFLKSTFSWLDGFPFVPLMLLMTTIFTFIYAATYLYLYYRRMLNYDNSIK